MFDSDILCIWTLLFFETEPLLIKGLQQDTAFFSQGIPMLK